MATVDAVLAQYEKSKNSASGNANKVSNEERLKKYFTTVLPNGVKSLEKRIRILPTPDGSSPFKEVYYHELQVDDGKEVKWTKLYDPKQEGKRSPLNEVYETLRSTGIESDKELAKQYRSRKFYIVKVIDRENEQDGPKFWRFKHNTKQEGALDKIFPIFQKRGDITDVETGRDITLFLSLSRAGNGKDYTVINSVIPEDPSPLHTDPATLKAWSEDPLTYEDVYSKKSEDYLDIIVSGKVPRWDVENKKWVAVSKEKGEETLSSRSSAPVEDPQEDDDASEDLPF